MPHNVDLVVTLAGSLAAALVMGLAARALRVSPIVGYLVAGILVGPHTPGFIGHRDIAEQLAELGVVLLMFGVGLHFRARDLVAVRSIAVPGAIVQIAIATALGALVARGLGLSVGGALVFGVAISVASTVVLTRVLADNRALHTPAGHVAVGWLIVEDLFTVFVLVLMPALAGGEAQSPTEILGAIVGATLKLGVLVAFTMTIGARVIPMLLRRVARTRSRELFTLAVLTIALGIAVGSALLFGASMALGAFLAGMVVGQSDFATRAGSEALPMRDAFAVLFFVSVGMLFDPGALGARLGAILATSAVVVLAKPIAAYVVVRLLRRSRATALTVALALAQIGEFSFIVGTLGTSLGLLPRSAMQILVAVSIVSIALNPVAFRLLPIVVRALGEPPVHARPPSEPPAEHHAIVVGHGPVGRTLTRLLRENGIAPTVIELNLTTVAHLQRAGVRALYGDASQLEVLEQAGARTAEALIFAGSGSPPEAVIRAARELNPELRVLARATYLRDAAAAGSAGATFVVSDETEVALAMTEALLTQLGATRDQLDRTRDRVRSELSPHPR